MTGQGVRLVRGKSMSSTGWTAYGPVFGSDEDFGREQKEQQAGRWMQEKRPASKFRIKNPVCSAWRTRVCPMAAVFVSHVDVSDATKD